MFILAISCATASPILSYTITDLGTLGGMYSWAYRINASGQVVGSATITGNTTWHAFLYDGTMQDLGTLGGRDSYAIGINNAGQIVGVSQTPTSSSEYRAFLYSGGTMYDLNDYLLGGSGWTLQSASDINDAGQIVGYGTINGETHAFLATPVSATPILEPTTIVLMGCGLLGLLGITVRHRRKAK